jgi:hypothetical protein
LGVNLQGQIVAYLAGMKIVLDIDFSEVDAKEAEDYTSAIVKKYAELIFNQKLDLTIQIVEGSLKINIAIIGALYLAIGQYGSFRSGVDYLIKDAKTLKEIVVSKLVRNGVDESDIIESSKHNCVPDKIRRVLLSIDRLESKRNLAPAEFKKELSKIKTSVKNICIHLKEKDIGLFATSINPKYLPEDSEIPEIAIKYKLAVREEDIKFFPIASFDKLPVNMSIK